ncbi:MAG: DUF2336 domain-containing protein [Hyphomicrobiaceae bacterium]|nr:DUF2336 domain-containing protein [Hyphomicrobiaceae bacterium]
MALVVEEFLGWVDGAPLERRIDAASALARSYLHSPLDPRERRMIEAGLLVLLDDASPKVRLRLAETLAPHAGAPRHVLSGLIGDLPAIAAPVLMRAPLLDDAELLGAIRQGGETRLRAIARRESLSDRVMAALARHTGLESSLDLLEHHGRRLGEGDLLALIDRHGENPVLREALTACGRQSVAIQRRLIGRISEAMGGSGLVRNALGDKDLKRVTRDASEKAYLEMAASCTPAELVQLVGGLVENGDLTASTLLRACVIGNRAFLTTALALLCDLPEKKVDSILASGRQAALGALVQKAELPPVAAAIVSMAVAIWREVARYRIELDPALFSQAMLDALDEGDLDMVFTTASERSVIAHLRRIALDILRDDARAYAQLTREAAA